MSLKKGHSYRWKRDGKIGRGVFEDLAPAQPDHAVVRQHVARFDGYVPQDLVQVPAADLAPIADLRAPSGDEPAAIAAARDLAAGWLHAHTRAESGALDARHAARTARLTHRYADPESAGFLGCIEPADRSFIAFVEPRGFTLVFARDAAGAPDAEPVTFQRDATTLEPRRAWREKRDDNDDETAYQVVTRYDVAIHLDRPKGTERVGVDENGVPWRVMMTCDYGFFPNTMGGDHRAIDCYVGDRTDCKEVHIIEQVLADGSDDEQKVMLCHGTAEDALRVYQAHTPARFFGRMWPMPVREWKKQLRAAQSDPMMPYRFTSPMVPSDDEPASERSRALQAARPAAAPAIHVKPARDPRGADALVRLAEEPVVLPPGELFFTRAATVAEGIDEKARRVPFVMSTESQDSYGTILRAKWDLSRFIRNPVLLWMHNRRADLPPVGRMGEVRVDNRQLLGNAYFDDTPFDDLIWEKYRKGFMRGGSVGFDPLEAHIEVVNGEEVIVFGENALTEFSCAVVPSNADALVDVKQRVRGLVTRSRDKVLRDPRGLRALLEEDRAARAHATVTVPGAVVSTPAEPQAPPVLAFEAGSRGVPCYVARTCITEPLETGPQVGAIRRWASRDGSGAVETIDWDRYATAFGLVDPDHRGSLRGYRLPLAVPRDGALVWAREALQHAVATLRAAAPPFAIRAEDRPALQRVLQRIYESLGLPDPWKAPNPAGGSPATIEGKNMKRIPKDKIKTPVGGGAVCLACPGCNEELEVVQTDLPADPAIVAEHSRAIETANGERQRLAAEKTAAETRAVEAEKRSHDLLGDVGRMLIELATRDVDTLVGKKINPSERDAELDVARVYIETGMRLVETTDDKGQKAQEYEGLVKWRERFKRLQERADIGLVGRSAQAGRPDPAPPRGEQRNVPAAAPRQGAAPAAGNQRSAPALPPGATSGGGGLANRITTAAAAKPAEEPRPRQS